MKAGKVEDVTIRFGFYRGVEEILKGKVPTDALVITPRVCGFSHAHLLCSGTGLWKMVTPQSRGIPRLHQSSCEKGRMPISGSYTLLPWWKAWITRKQLIAQWVPILEPIYGGPQDLGAG